MSDNTVPNLVYVCILSRNLDSRNIDSKSVIRAWAHLSHSLILSAPFPRTYPDGRAHNERKSQADFVPLFEIDNVSAPFSLSRLFIDFNGAMLPTLHPLYPFPPRKCLLSYWLDSGPVQNVQLIQMGYR